MPSKYTRNDQLLVLNNIHKYVQWNWLWNKAWWSIHVTSPYKQARKKRGGRGGWFFFSFFLEKERARRVWKGGKQPERPQISPRNLSFSTRSSLCACLLQTTRRRRWFQEHVSNNNNFPPLFDEPDHRPNPRLVGRSVVSGGPRARRGGHSSDRGRKRSKGWLAASSCSQRPKGGD